MGVSSLLLLTKRKKTSGSEYRQYRIRVTDEGHTVRITHFNWKTGKKEHKFVDIKKEDVELANVLKRARR